MRRPEALNKKSNTALLFIKTLLIIFIVNIFTMQNALGDEIKDNDFNLHDAVQQKSEYERQLKDLKRRLILEIEVIAGQDNPEDFSFPASEEISEVEEMLEVLERRIKEEERRIKKDAGNPFAWGVGEIQGDGTSVPVRKKPEKKPIHYPTPSFADFRISSDFDTDKKPNPMRTIERPLIKTFERPLIKTYERPLPDTDKKPDKETKPKDDKKPVKKVEPKVSEKSLTDNILAEHLQKVIAAVKQAKTAIDECDGTAYHFGVTEAKEQTEIFPIVMYRMTEADQKRNQTTLKFMIAAAKEQLASIPPYPNPCAKNAVWYPELEYIADQYRIAMRLRKWAYYVCNLEAQHKFVDDFTALDNAIKSMRAAAQKMIVTKPADIGGTSLRRDKKQGEHSKLIWWIDWVDKIEPYEAKQFKKLKYGRSTDSLCLGPGSTWESTGREAPTPDSPVMERREPVKSARKARAKFYEGKRAIPLPIAVREAAINAGVDIPPYKTLVGTKN